MGINNENVCTYVRAGVLMPTFFVLLVFRLLFNGDRGESFPFSIFPPLR